MEQGQPGNKQDHEYNGQRYRSIAVLADADVNPAGTGGEQTKPGQPAGAEQLVWRLMDGDQQDQKHRQGPPSHHR